MTASKLLVKREGDFHYPICFEEDFSNLAQVMKEEGLVDRKICIVTDSNVGPLYEESVKQVLSEVSSDISVFTFEAGEKNKNLNTVSALYQALIQNGLDRKSLLVALGGGVVGDLTGFGAATYLRGIDFIQVPTTLLAQVDSSVGGKTGVDFQQYKNMVGAFHQPRLVYMNPPMPRANFPFWSVSKKRGAFGSWKRLSWVSSIIRIISSPALSLETNMMEFGSLSSMITFFCAFAQSGSRLIPSSKATDLNFVFIIS